jgi:hypothetical protein
LIAVKDFAVNVKGFNQVIQTVKAANYCTFAAAGRTNKGSNAIFRNLDRDILYCQETAVVNIKILSAKDGLSLAGGALKVRRHTSRWDKWLPFQ